MLITGKEAYRIPNRLNQKIKSSYYIIIKILSVQNKERMLKVARREGKVPNKANVKIIPEYSTEI